MRHIYDESGFDTTVPAGSYWEESGGEPVQCSDLSAEHTVTGEATALAEIPLVIRSQPPKFPFPFLRTTYLRTAYSLYRIKDEYF